MDYSVYIFLAAIYLAMILPCSSVSPDNEVLLLEKKVEKLRNISDTALQNYNATLEALSVARQWQKTTDDMAKNATSDLQEVMVKTTAEAVKRAEKDTSKCMNKLVLARIALRDAEAKLEAARNSLALVNAKRSISNKSSASTSLVASMTTVTVFVVTLCTFNKL